MMKQWLVLLSILSVLVLAACGGDEDPADNMENENMNEEEMMEEDMEGEMDAEEMAEEDMSEGDMEKEEKINSAIIPIIIVRFRNDEA
ncbi:hypothetical protein MUN88_00270 [Gracilibacillus caseinilyticus]|uniref:Uncharacterized protein n=1 Tax=Gracilibacillus caseinilyticus TaxID=2932256 RepID=A0ABY4EXE4_9BACI|nr:hypothetical protein [Gracilibacillus caseinilyticus]UOQ48635.1 hypothetical protein MUN88_00270 [Gracilibacillus caseinilyticus]